MPLNPDAVGRAFEGPLVTIEAAHVRQFAEATDDLNPRYVRGELASPMFAMRPLIDTLFDALRDPTLGADMLRLVHGEQEMVWHEALQVGEVIVPKAKIASIAQKASGELVTLSQWLERPDGRVAVETTSALFIRAKDKPAGDSAEAKPRAEPEERGAPSFKLEQPVAADQSLQYAAISNDRNPIHTDPETARAAGLPDVILHGLCTLSFAAKAVVNARCGGDPTRLRSLRARFARPVFNGDQLTIWGWAQADGEVALEVVNQHGAAVLTRAAAQLR